MSYNHDHENEVNYFAKTNFRNQMTKFGIKTDDRRRHMYVIGKTGMGKSVLLENLTLSDIYAGHGCCYVDPHGDTAEKLIDFIPSWRLNDVVYFNPADLEYPVGFNILEAVDERHKHLVASGMMAVFAKIWENMWSSRMEYILNNTLLALLDNQGQTMLGINRMMSDAEYRKRMVGNVKDPVVKQFWVTEFASWTEKYATEATAAIQNKIGQFLSAGVIRNIVAQVKSTINIREIMDTEKIFIINLSKGRIGEDNSRLLGGLVITKIQLAAMERVDIPEDQRLDFYLYVDEFQNFAVESFASILSEARKYRLCLTMAHQYIAQLTEPVRDAVFGNVGTMITFRVGSPDAMFMEAEFMPRFTPEDIINLPKYNIYIKLLIDGVTSQPFSAITLPPIAQITNSAQKVIKISRERYAQPRSAIEDKILVWSGMANADVDEMMKVAEQKKQASTQASGGKPRFEYNCTRCNTEVVLPVELDRSRPIYCDDCITIVREERKGKKGKTSDRSGASRAETKQVEKSPSPSEGASIERLPDEPSISLGSLVKPERETREEVRVEPAVEGEPTVIVERILDPEPIPVPVKQERKEPVPVPSVTTEKQKDSYEYTCSDCATLFSAGVKLDPSRPLFCQNCLEKIRAKRRGETRPDPSGPSQTSSDPTKRKRKRKRKSPDASRGVTSAQTGTTAPARTTPEPSVGSQRPIVSKSPSDRPAPVVTPKQPVRESAPAPQESKPTTQSGSLKTGQTIRFE
ncbi:hypothetical protein COV05_04030 [Candidatus Uhrbacteria bacterium CG10_big_fil_rev_8_21_14_0_10_48_16]|uniref:Type IV secretion system coupling protein TraD DNA-binding domain-containing protein n=1 Tax=Candidatus Uhrbacteria bacterium CG10_big_fil_rev_8_21_14_0_10_48_16 TaxID=1975038 RepID=A0A2M8LGD3_9BACT|nr:MAG: hypothetical protein COV05_04030 [Candidatus Uhrbacteria bacterium CG10_big_fil_rev_8_21_14_0_10_48_16]